MPTNTIDAFHSKINSGGLARANKYYVEIEGPIASSTGLTVMCDTVTLAGRNLTTSVAREYGALRHIVYGSTYAEFNMSFLCSDGLSEKIFFEDWQALTVPTPSSPSGGGAFDAEYYDSYVGRIRVKVLNEQMAPTYTCTYYEAFPRTITALDLGYAINNSLLRVSVTMGYAYWGSGGGSGYHGTVVSDESLYEAEDFISDEDYG